MCCTEHSTFDWFESIRDEGMKLLPLVWTDLMETLQLPQMGTLDPPPAAGMLRASPLLPTFMVRGPVGILGCHLPPLEEGADECGAGAETWWGAPAPLPPPLRICKWHHEYSRKHFMVRIRAGAIWTKEIGLHDQEWILIPIAEACIDQCSSLTTNSLNKQSWIWHLHDKMYVELMPKTACRNNKWHRSKPGNNHGKQTQVVFKWLVREVCAHSKFFWRRANALECMRLSLTSSSSPLSNFWTNRNVSDGWYTFLSSPCCSGSFTGLVCMASSLAEGTTICFRPAGATSFSKFPLVTAEWATAWPPSWAWTAARVADGMKIFLRSSCWTVSPSELNIENTCKNAGLTKSTHNMQC